MEVDKRGVPLVSNLAAKSDSKYMRKSMMEIRGIPRDHPLPEDTEDSSPLFYNTDSPGRSGSRHSPTVESQSWMADSNGWISTEISTDQSSVYSWVDDDFERTATRTVRQLFEEIDRRLYENATSTHSQTDAECRDWIHRCAHLRLLGEQLLKPEDDWVQCVERPGPGPSELLEVEVESNPSLSLVGHVLVPSPMDDSEELFLRLFGETLASDGSFEELYAFDAVEEALERRQGSSRRVNRGFPPLSPLACLYDNVISNLFDKVWLEVLVWTRPLCEHLVDSKTSIAFVRPQAAARDVATPKAGREAFVAAPTSLSRPEQNLLGLLTTKKIGNANDGRPTSSIAPRAQRLGTPQRSRLRSKGPLAPIEQGRLLEPGHGAGLRLQGSRLSTEPRLTGSQVLAKGPLPPIVGESTPRTPKVGGRRVDSAAMRSLFAVDSRPNTTHTMRSDTPSAMTRRLSSPMGTGPLGRLAVQNMHSIRLHGTALAQSSTVETSNDAAEQNSSWGGGNGQRKSR